MLHKWESMISEINSITFIGVESRPVAFLGFGDQIIELISFTVALRKSIEFECLNLFYLNYALMVFIILDAI